MIFATDLDRTLIFSHLFLETAECPYSLIETKKDKPIAYMSKRAIQLLKEVGEKAHIIPISLRNEEEFHRIELFKDVVMPEIFVTNNGGSIYYHGQEDKQWKQHIKAQMDQLTWCHEAVREKFMACYAGKIEKVVNCGDLVWLFMGERDHIDEAGLMRFQKEMAHTSWRAAISGRKMYVYPFFVTKWQALSYIQSHYFKEPIVAAGDSIFDLEMVAKANYGIVPKNCFIKDCLPAHVAVTNHEGILAADEILEFVLEKIKNDIDRR